MLPASSLSGFLLMQVRTRIITPQLNYPNSEFHQAKAAQEPGKKMPGLVKEDQKKQESIKGQINFDIV